ncbi:MAG: hypothetical protein ACEPOZ_01525 [Marinifilaceae bacterium]
MKVLKRSICLVFLLLGINCVTEASANSSAEKRAEMITRWMQEKLELTLEQMPKVEALNLKYEKEFDRLVFEKNGFSCMQAVRDSLKQKEKELKLLFTSHQFEEYRKCKCELKEELKKQTKYLN